MNDYDKLKKCFDEIGIEYEDIIDPYKNEILIRLFSSCLPIEIYSFVFKSNGSFVKIDWRRYEKRSDFIFKKKIKFK